MTKTLKCWSFLWFYPNLNLFKYSFTKNQFKALNEDLNFCSTPEYYSKKVIRTNIKTFIRKTELKASFERKVGNNTNKNNNTMWDILTIKGKSNWEIQKDHDTINSFIEVVDKHTGDILEHKQALPQNNISIDLVFTKVNKVGATVTLDFVNYTEKTSGELNNENYYKKFNHDLTQEHTNH